MRRRFRCAFIFFFKRGYSVQSTALFIKGSIVLTVYRRVSTQHRVLLRIIGPQRKRPDHRMTSYNRALEITRCESIETTLRTRKLLWAGALIRMSCGRLPKRIVFRNLEGTVRRVRSGKEKEWTDRSQSDIRAFGIAGDWKATASKAAIHRIGCPPGKTTLHGGQSRSWSAEQGKENKKRKSGSA